MNPNDPTPKCATPNEVTPNGVTLTGAAPTGATPTDATPSSRSVEVRYAAPGGGSGPLTLGQDNMIRCIRREAPEQINKESAWPVPDGTTVSAGLAALRRLVERHESLRTSFPAGPGPDGYPQQQVVHPEGRFSVTVVETGDRSDAELDMLAAEFGRTDVAVAVDLASAPRLRCTLLADGERLLRLVAVVCHAGADGAAIALLIQDWVALAAGKDLPPVTAPTPLRIAEAERSPQGRRRSATALRHWARILTTGPQAVFADARIAGPPHDLGAVLVRSRGAAADLAAVCRRTGASPSVVLFAAFAALVARRAGRADLSIAALSANRQRAALVDHVGTLAQDALIRLDTGAADFDELIGRAKSASFNGYWHSTLDAEQVWQLVEDAAHVRGVRFPRQVVVNDLSLTIPTAVADIQPVPAVDPELTRLPAPPLGVRLMFTILRISGSLDFALIACPQVLDADETDRFAQALLAVLAAAADGPVPLHALPGLAEVPTPERGEGWRPVDGAWVDLSAVRGLLEEAIGSRASVEVDVESGELVATLTFSGASVEPAEVHRAVVAALPGRDTAVAPHRYVVRGSEGVVAGDGRDPEVIARVAALT
ncbi:condensation domain-containing protein [Kitasatospora sp. NPDC101176]|uniref:condensation domain-containing protein n=1 Tax=Kitasatospora sp. NPDC101176 TaxID=3364099 RepID=UPI003802B666